jgi:hypothetical protein
LSANEVVEHGCVGELKDKEANEAHDRTQQVKHLTRDQLRRGWSYHLLDKMCHCDSHTDWEEGEEEEESVQAYRQPKQKQPLQLQGYREEIVYVFSVSHTTPKTAAAATV